MTDCYLEDQRVYLLKDSRIWGHSRVSMICRVSALLYSHTLQIITFLPAARHCQSHSWEVSGGTSQASKGHLQLHSPGTWSFLEKVVLSFFPFKPFCFTPLAIFLFSQPPLPYPARWIRHPTRCILQCHKGTPKMVELVICLSQEVLSYPTVSKTALTLTTSWMLLQGSCLRLSDLQGRPIWPPWFG